MREIRSEIYMDVQLTLHKSGKDSAIRTKSERKDIGDFRLVDVIPVHATVFCNRKPKLGYFSLVHVNLIAELNWRNKMVSR